MKIKMNTLTIIEYCCTDRRIERFCKEVEEYPLFTHYVSSDIGKLIEDSQNMNELLVGPGYILADERKLIGYLRLADLDFDGVLNLHYGVHPDFRRNIKHYGTRILMESSQYIFKNISNVKRIELFIKEMNKGSIKCAENANYILSREIVAKNGNNKILVYDKMR